MKTRLKIAPSCFPDTLGGQKLPLRMESDEDVDDALLAAYNEAATTTAETDLARKIVRQTWYGYPVAWPDEDYIILPYGQNGVNSIKYYDEDGVETTFTDYTVDSGGQRDAGRIVLTQDSEWPSDSLRDYHPIIIEFTCGWPVGADWEPGTAYAAGAVVYPTNRNTLAYESSGGTSDVSEPAAWGLEVGATTVDNDITWTCLGPTIPQGILEIIRVSVTTMYMEPSEILPGNHPNLHYNRHRSRLVWQWRINEEDTP